MPLLKPFIRISSFFKKELAEIFRQPKLILSLILGPFLIVLLFGVGYPNEGRSLRTIFVISKQNPLADQVEGLAKTIGPAIIYQGMQSDKQTALATLANNRTDMVVVVPDNPVGTLQNNQQVTLQIYHNEVDPFQVAYVKSVGRIYTDEVNRRILEAMATQGQNNLNNLDGTQLPSISSQVLVSPFTTDVLPLSKVQFTPVGFLSPAVIVLLLQHLAVTFAALSIIRERRSGIMELFHVSPLSALEALFGKYFSYVLIDLVIAAALTGLVVWIMGVPMLGNWWHYFLVFAMLLFASLGFGFIISLISDTEIQAVQYSMLFLLTSIFFSGFFLDLRMLRHPMEILAWALPATYGIHMLQDIMLRGHSIPILTFAALFIIGFGLFLVNLLLLRKKMDTPNL
jgi:ABC-2 type transport system permease protein